ncbi:MAG TPA: AAA family ATPase [Burkholderiales bacterium]|nr:AAA family ATPase [Burkholderiales bacterium]
MFKSLQKYKRPLQFTGAALVLAASFALAWYTINAPEPGRDQRATSMEKESAAYFATERDFSALAQDARSGAALSIGLAADYALVHLQNGDRYYVRTDTQRPLVVEVLKEKLAAETPAVFALSGVQPPASPIASALRHLNNPSMLSLVGTVLIVGCMIWLMGPMMRSAGFSKAQKPTTRFRDVVGVEEAKEALQDIVAYLRNPAQFSSLGAKPPKGVVLEGHFGAGKTLLARAVAGEAGVPFIPLSGGDFTDMFLGVGVRRVRKLFEMARKNAPCVVFIDEIEGIGRRSSGGGAAETENNRIINTLLVELDGFAESAGIVVLGATNNVKNLDPAMVRPGRFDRTCTVGLPDIAERQALFALYAGKLRVSGETDFRQLARISTGLSPAAIANVVNAAALLAAKEEAPAVAQEHFHRVLEQHLLGGPATPGAAALDANGRRRIAVHEAGHAVVAKLLAVGIVEKVSILKRGRSLGATLVTTDTDTILQSEPEMRARMTMLMGGRGAEALILGSISTGAANDLEHVSTMAYRMVTEFGFSRNMGPFSYAGLPDQERRIADHPEAIAEAREIVKGVERECAELLAANRPALERLTAALLEHETVSGEVVDTCLSPKTGQPLGLAA